jgi:hypothetical protein
MKWQITLRDITNTVNAPVSRQTVSRRLNETGIKSYAARQKPFLKPEHIAKRLQWALKHQHWTIEDWARVIWSDECSIVVGLNTKRPRIWRRKGEEMKMECIVPRFKGQRVAIMVWACFSLHHLSEMVVYPKGGIGSKEYLQTLDDALLPFIEQLFPETDDGDTIAVISPDAYIFMQDNAPCHSSKLCQKYFKEKQLSLMEWPPYSPDLNPIENLWSDFKTRFHKRFTDLKADVSSAQEAKERYGELLKQVWRECREELVHALVESMPRRCQAVIANNGGHTKY